MPAEQSNKPIDLSSGTIDVASSPALQRLIEEIRIESWTAGDQLSVDRSHNRYDRQHNRHNR
jgi:hypothetical protein